MWLSPLSHFLHVLPAPLGNSIIHLRRYVQEKKCSCVILPLLSCMFNYHSGGKADPLPFVSTWVEGMKTLLAHFLEWFVYPSSPEELNIHNSYIYFLFSDDYHEGFLHAMTNPRALFRTEMLVYLVILILHMHWHWNNDIWGVIFEASAVIYSLEGSPYFLTRSHKNSYLCALFSKTFLARCFYVPYCTFRRSFKEKRPLSGAKTQVQYVNPGTFLLCSPGHVLLYFY